MASGLTAISGANGIAHYAKNQCARSRPPRLRANGQPRLPLCSDASSGVRSTHLLAIPQPGAAQLGSAAGRKALNDPGLRVRRRIAGDGHLTRHGHPVGREVQRFARRKTCEETCDD